MRKSRVVLDVVTGMLVTIALLLAALSLRWPLVHDLPIMLYEGYLIRDVGLAPYRDFFDMNPPGTMLIYTFIHFVTSGQDLACRIVDIVILIFISFFTYLSMHNHGHKSGLFSSSIFAISYISSGYLYSIQREYICILFFSLSLFLTTYHYKTISYRRIALFILGLLAGACFCVKPPLVILWIPLVLYNMHSSFRSPDRKTMDFSIFHPKYYVSFIIGFLSVITFILLWLSIVGSLESFIDMFIEYYPLYTRLDGSGSVRPDGLAQVFDRYFVRSVPLLLGPFSLIAFLGLFCARNMKSKSSISQVLMFAVCMLFSLLYVPIGGKFWIYQQFPLYYFLALLAGMVVSQRLPSECIGSRWHAAVLVLALSASLPYTTMNKELDMWRRGQTYRVKQGTVSQVSAYLGEHMGTADTIMPLDVTSGAIHVLYKLRRPLYGHFIYDFHFYHHPTSPYTQRLRNEFIGQFTPTEPDFILQCQAWRCKGAECDESFPELAAILDARYEPVFQSAGCAVLQLKDADVFASEPVQGSR